MTNRFDPEKPPDGVVVWELDPGKHPPSYWVRHGSADFGRFDDWEKAMTLARREALQRGAHVWLRRRNDYTRVWTFRAEKPHDISAKPVSGAAKMIRFVLRHRELGCVLGFVDQVASGGRYELCCVACTSAATPRASVIVDAAGFSVNELHDALRFYLEVFRESQFTAEEWAVVTSSNEVASLCGLILTASERPGIT